MDTQIKILAQGAEAVISLNKHIIKRRIRKAYRINKIDEKLCSFRTRREAKILKKLEAIGFPSPKLISTDDKEVIEMEFIEGELVKSILEKVDYHTICMEIGTKIALLHNNGIIHADLTTSNIILAEEIYFIDFGLSYFSHKIEDMAVELNLLRSALDSKHYRISRDAFLCVLDGYTKESKQGISVIQRLEVVEKRGRYKHRY